MRLLDNLPRKIVTALDLILFRAFSQLLEKLPKFLIMRRVRSVRNRAKQSAVSRRLWLGYIAPLRAVPARKASSDSSGSTKVALGGRM